MQGCGPLPVRNGVITSPIVVPLSFTIDLQWIHVKHVNICWKLLITSKNQETCWALMVFFDVVVMKSGDCCDRWSWM